MQRFIMLRFGQAILAFFAVSIIVFGLARISGNPLDTLLSFEAGSDPVQRALIEEYWGLDKSLPEQYGRFIWNAMQGDFGDSFKYRLAAADLIKDRAPNTFLLAGLAIVVATLIALPIGVLSAVKKDTPLDYFGKILALIGQSAPPFWLGLLLMWIFAVKLGLVQTSGRGGFTSFILPAGALGLFWVAALMRLVRSAMLDVLDSEYVKLARIKGLGEWKVIWKHVFRNAAIAPLTFFGLILGNLLLGSVSIETVFQWPGLGFLAFEAVFARDFPLVQGIVLVFSAIFIVVNLIVDILYAYLDPRIRYK
ncbi:MAG: ABC transporter permease [SAR202 cluster bacterium Io17-Chloro-G4]|nr:MAG: ABC transporter permease [SAR202 cluster bacterium Io17-Chloro-G4]